MEKLNLANLPTQIEKLRMTPNGCDIYIKRDDQTGFEMSGNKVRKLEYVLQDCLDHECDTVITCGGIQSNHCRATAFACRKLGLDIHLVLKDNEGHEQGNYFLNQLLDVNFHIISVEDYQNRRPMMIDLAKKLTEKGKRVYVIPEGASNGIGNLGYKNAFEEILEQETTLGLKFDYIVSAFGSGSTYTGLQMGIEEHGTEHINIGYNIYNVKADEIKLINVLREESGLKPANTSDIVIRKHAVGDGYAKSTDDEIEIIKKLAREEGLVLDTVYTGKAFKGMLDDIASGFIPANSKVLFIHTGGHFGNFSKINLFRA